MIYAKIFTEKDERGEDVLVFDSCPLDNENLIRRAGLKRLRDKTLICFCTIIYGFEYIAISPEAKALFKRRLNEAEKVLYSADFELRKEGFFSFRPDHILDAIAKKTEFPDEEICRTERRLREGDSFKLTVGNGSYRQGLDEMIEGDNEAIRRLDLSAPRDPSLIQKGSKF